MSTLKVGTIQNADGTRTKYTASAWVNFNGTGTPSVRDGENVSSITDRGTGFYRINFTTAMTNSTYCAISGCKKDNTVNDANYTIVFGASDGVYSTTAVDVNGQRGSDGMQDNANIFVAIFGGDA